MKIIAHRGLSEAYPENTLLAFEKALECGADGIETDLRLSRDHVPVLFHDDSLRRMTGLDQAPEELTFQELQALNISCAQKIPSLEQLLSLVHARATLILEIKYHPLTYQPLCDILNEMICDKLTWVEVSCFDDRVLEYLHRLNPDIRLHKLIDDPRLLEDKEFEIRYHYTDYFDIDIRLSPLVQRHGLLNRHKIIYWTVSLEDITHDMKEGVYAVMTNNPIPFL